MIKHTIIIGNGISGITAARHIRKKSDQRITVISAESPHFFSRTALMYVYMGHMPFTDTKPYEDWFWKKNKIELLQDRVIEIATEKKQLILENTPALAYDNLIIATGSKPSFYDWPGQDLPGVQGLYSKQDLDLLEIQAPNAKICKRAVVVGGGLIGVELAEMLHSRHIAVTFLVRENEFWDGVLPTKNAALIGKHILSHGIDLRTNTSLKEIHKGPDGRVAAITTAQGENIICDLVGISTGVQPNIDFLKNSGIRTDKGILVNRYLETNMAQVYAIGDCAQQQEPTGLRRPIEAVWYTGRMMGEVVAQSICSQKTPYKPGHWFNSAKFFDIEYQTYGWVHSERRKPEYEVHFNWQHPNENIALTIAYDQETETLLGLNSFGMRTRHKLIDRWLTEGRDISYVLAHWADALFDPEFSTSYQSDILKIFNSSLNRSVQKQKKSWSRIFNSLKNKR